MSDHGGIFSFLEFRIALLKNQMVRNLSEVDRQLYVICLDWDETEPKEIADQSASMPDGWLEDESSMIPDPNAVKPVDWYMFVFLGRIFHLFLCRDDEIDGVWEAPNIDNPRCQDAPGCGEWTAPMISNPLYKGPWRAPLVDNPNYSVCSISFCSTRNIVFFLGSMGTTKDFQS